MRLTLQAVLVAGMLAVQPGLAADTPSVEPHPAHPSAPHSSAAAGETPAYVAPRVATLPVQAYPFVHLDGCTGVCEFVIVRGKLIPIEFTPDSDAAALKLLYALKAEIFLPNAHGPSPRLYVVGQLFDGISRDVQGPGWGYDPGHHDFLLTRWYLATPFVEDQRLSNDLPQLAWPDEKLARYKPTARRTLRRSDFKGADGMSIDLDALLGPEPGRRRAR